jgi:hypothetical protein
MWRRFWAPAEAEMMCLFEPDAPGPPEGKSNGRFEAWAPTKRNAH